MTEAEHLLTMVVDRCLALHLGPAGLDPPVGVSASPEHLRMVLVRALRHLGRAAPCPVCSWVQPLVDGRVKGHMGGCPRRTCKGSYERPEVAP